MSHSTGIETNGVEQIPDDQRDASPLDLFRLIFGGANTFATAVLGSFPVLFGLSFQAGVWAILLGVGVGALILAPMGLFGALNGTNNAVSSGRTLACTGASSVRSCRCSPRWRSFRCRCGARATPWSAAPSAWPACRKPT